MKLSLLLLLFSIQIFPQWTETSLGGAQYGYNLYVTNSEVFAATLNGVYSTTDTGNPWFSIGLTNTLVFDVITSNQYILAATEGTGPGVYRSSDHGSTWTGATGIENQSVRAFTKNSSYVFACTWGGGIFRSSDDGATWDSLGLTNEGFRSMYAVGETIYAGGSKVYYSTDNGNTWETRQLPYPAGDTRGFCYDDGILYAADSGIYASPDSGNTWQLVSGVTFDGSGNVIDAKVFYSIVAYNHTLVSSGVAIGTLISYDSAKTWNDFNQGFGQTDWTFNSLKIKGSYLWALRSDFGNAYLRPLTDVTAVDLKNNTHPTKFLLLQNYPNPFNPVTTIRYELPSESKVSITVYNLLGQKIKELINQIETSGFHEINFDGDNLASGIYLFRIKALTTDGRNSFNQTKKMVLLK